MAAQPGRPSPAAVQAMAPVGDNRPTVQALLVLLQVVDHFDCELGLNDTTLTSGPQTLLHGPSTLRQEIFAMATAPAMVGARRSPTVEAAPVRTILQSPCAHRASVRLHVCTPLRCTHIRVSSATPLVATVSAASAIHSGSGRWIDPSKALVGDGRHRRFSYCQVRRSLGDHSIRQNQVPLTTELCPESVPVPGTRTRRFVLFRVLGPLALIPFPVRIFQ